MSKTGETKIINTKKAFWKAFCQLCTKQEPDKITVSQLCREAGLNRTTFYKYYHVPADIVQEMTYRLLETVPQYNQEGRLDDLQTIQNLCRQCYENKDILRLYMSANGNLSTMIYRIIQGSSAQMPFLNLKENIFLMGGILQTILIWMLQEYKETPDEMAEILLKYIRIFQKAVKESPSATTIHSVPL